jgi:hypothetical protein
LDMLQRRRGSSARRGTWGPWSASVLALALVAGWGGNAVAGVERAPVKTLPPGLVTLASVPAPQGTVAISLHRIRYLGKVRLCLRETSITGGATGTCTSYPLGSQLRGAVVWWLADFSVCVTHRYQVIAGVVMRPGLTASLRTAAGTAPMRTAAIPSAFGVSGDLIYALIDTGPDTVTLHDTNGRTAYYATVSPIPKLAFTCGSGTTIGIAIGGAGPHTIP